MADGIEFELPEKPSLAEGSGLIGFLRQNAGASVDISARGLRRLDTPLVQCLIAAAVAWRARGLVLRLTALPPAMADRLALLGVTQAHLVVEVQG